MNGTLAGKLSLVGLILLLCLALTLYFSFTPAPRRAAFAPAPWSESLDALARLQPPDPVPSTPAQPAAQSAGESALARWHELAAAPADQLADALRSLLDLERAQSAWPIRKQLQSDLAELLIDYEASFALLKLCLSTGSPGDRATFENRWRAALAAQDRFAPAASLWTSRQAALWRTAAELRRQLEPLPERIIARRAAAPISIPAAASPVDPTSYKQELARSIREARRLVESAMETEVKKTERQRREANQALLIGLSLTALAALLALGWALHSINQPVRVLRRAVEQWASGKGAGPRRIEPVCEDELGRLAGDLNKLIDQVRRTITHTTSLGAEIAAGFARHQREQAAADPNAAPRLALHRRQNATRLAAMLQQLQRDSTQFRL